MAKRIVYHEKAREALVRGMGILAKTASVTLGPSGKNIVLVSKSGVPQITNDGATILKEIELLDQLENIGAAILKQAALRTNDTAGDGTTTATVLAYAMSKEAARITATGLSPTLVKKGIEKAVRFATNRLLEYSRPVESMSDIINVASISAGNDPAIGLIIGKAIQQVGREGIVVLEEGSSSQTHLEISEGMIIEKGFMSPQFLTKSDSIIICQDNPLVLLLDKKIDFPHQELIHVLEQVAEVKRSLLIIAEDISQESLSMLIMNRLKGIIDVVAVRNPGLGEARKHLLEDIAALTNGRVVSEDGGLSFHEISVNIMGSAKRAVISKDTTKIIASCSNKNLRLRCYQISRQIDVANNVYEKDQLRRRLSKLVDKVATIKIGASTEPEMKYKKLCFEDAISATKAAIDEGIVPGGGAALLHSAQILDLLASQSSSAEELAGIKIVAKALLLPSVIIAENAGLSTKAIIEHIKSADFFMGYDASTGAIVDMHKAGIIDPVKVARSALQNSLSIASVVLTTECLIGDQAISECK